MSKLGFELSCVNRPIVDDLSPRDLLFLKNLKKSGLVIREIRLSPISPLNGFKVSQLTLPEGTMVIQIVNKGETSFPSDDITLESGCIIYFLVQNKYDEELRELFIPKELI